MGFGVFLVVAAIGALGYFASNILLFVGLLGVPFLAATGWWTARSRSLGRTRLIVGAGLHSLFCGLPALYLLIRLTGDPPSKGANKLAYIFLFYIWIARIGFQLGPALEYDLKPWYLGTLAILSLLAGSLMCLASAGILIYLQRTHKPASDDNGLLIPVGYLLPFALAWVFFASDWLLNGFVERTEIR